MGNVMAESKESKYLIIKDEELFTDRYYKLSYRLVICYSLMRYFQTAKSVEYDNDRDNCRNFLSKVLGAIEENKPYCEPSFLEIYPFEKSISQSGFVVIDRSKACYPLVLYPEDDKPEHGDRISTFKTAVADIIDNLDKITPILYSDTIWNQDKVSRLVRSFDYPEKANQK
ncbi:MAG: hypothetical protein HKM04_09230 [Legionellales bacterium]|nr:hypothetical protein [Legionellales bacterium]